MLAPSSTLAKGVVSVGKRSRAIGSRKLASARLASSSASVPSSTAESVVKVASNLKTLADVEDLVLTYGLTNGAGHGGSLRALGSAGEAGTVRPLCVVKVGGEVVSTPSMRNDLVASLRFMRDFGLLPVVVHGGGPQLNDELKKAGVEPQYVGGHRVTDGPTMAVAKRVFEDANHTLAAALREGGLACEQFLGGVFRAHVADGGKLGLVGEIKAVDAAGVNAAIAQGKIPVLTSVGVNLGPEASSQPALNINADVAARELSIALQPLKVVYISAGGGWKEEGKVIDHLDMANDFARMEARDYTGRQGTLLKLREMKQIIDRVPAVSSVTICSASALAAQLLPHRGPGTQIRRGVKLHHYASLGAVDRTPLEALLRSAGASGAAGLALLAAHPTGSTGTGAPTGLGGARHVKGVIATEGFTAAAIILEPSSPGGLPEVACMVVSRRAMAEGVEAALWRELKAVYGPHGGLCWTALPSAPALEAAVAQVQAKGASVIPELFPALSYSRSVGQSSSALAQGAGGATCLLWHAGPSPTAVAAAVSALGATVSSGVSASSASSSAPSTAGGQAKSSGAIRVGLLGARGFVGRELLKLLAGHPQMTVVAAGSRALAGKDVATALGVPEAAAAVAPGTLFSDIGVEQLKAGPGGGYPHVDAWVLALPNGLCAPHAEAIEAGCKARGVPVPLMIDLSADMRFDRTGVWAYGLPEYPGQRDLLKRARKISNPGCYATGAQAALMPLLPQFVSGARASGVSWNVSMGKPHIFGVSGYSGAGTTPSDKNDPNRLRDNLLAYSLTNHIHEREVGWHSGLLAKDKDGGAAGTGAGAVGGGVAFMPHVAPFFQGIHLTVTGHVSSRDRSAHEIAEAYERFYEGEALVRVLGPLREEGGTGGMKKDGKTGKLLPLPMPDVASHGAYQHGVTVGGFTLDKDSGRLALVSCIDNLLKGAATQCLQNMNLALGLPEYQGIPMQ